ncbi:Os01g0863100, partial [Oryza sativa Japonica Group]
RLHGVLDLFWLVATSQTSHSIKVRVIPSPEDRATRESIISWYQSFSCLVRILVL